MGRRAALLDHPDSLVGVVDRDGLPEGCVLIKVHIEGFPLWVKGIAVGMTCRGIRRRLWVGYRGRIALR
jgi:hypothetical protein